jgi:hypothetical protein
MATKIEIDYRIKMSNSIVFCQQIGGVAQTE